ncbi:MAG: YicC/YloC family endoribonuclease [Candidatus Brocadiaceae bacterium]|jgi:uncharacterized protein (TIGR00255 family)
MTGFGFAEQMCERWVLRVEVRTVNHRDLQVSFRVPESFRLKEVELQKLAEKQVSRGHLYLSLTCEPRKGSAGVLLAEDTVADYLQALKTVSAAQGVPFEVDLASVLSLPGALRDLNADEELRDVLWESVVETSEEALDALVEMRRTEGANLSRQLVELCDTMAELVDGIEEEQGSFVPAYRDRLRERVNRLLEGTEVELNEESLAREVAICADRCDVSEEIARLRSHLDQFREALEGPDVPVGRKMEFIGQEMLREASTIAAKVPAGQQVRQVLELKTAVERLREQVRNVE